ARLGVGDGDCELQVGQLAVEDLDRAVEVEDLDQQLDVRRISKGEESGGAGARDRPARAARAVELIAPGDAHLIAAIETERRRGVLAHAGLRRRGEVEEAYRGDVVR